MFLDQLSHGACGDAWQGTRGAPTRSARQLRETEEDIVLAYLGSLVARDAIGHVLPTAASKLVGRIN